MHVVSPCMHFACRKSWRNTLFEGGVAQGERFKFHHRLHVAEHRAYLGIHEPPGQDGDARALGIKEEGPLLLGRDSPGGLDKMVHLSPQAQPQRSFPDCHLLPSCQAPRGHLMNPC